MHKIELESAVYEDKKRTLKIASKMKKTRHANAYNDSPRNIARIKNAFSPLLPPFSPALCRCSFVSSRRALGKNICP